MAIQEIQENDYIKDSRAVINSNFDHVKHYVWQPSTAYTAGVQIGTPSLPPECMLVCTTAGTSGSTEPDYTGVSVGDTVTDGTCVWLVAENATKEYVDTKAANYLPLAGGTMTGDIKLADTKQIANTVDNGLLRFQGGTEEGKGARVVLSGKDRNNHNGDFELVANDGTNSKTLLGKPDGTLTWGGQPLLPVGVVQAFAGSTNPAGWLVFEVRAVSRTTYAALFAVIGTKYGAGNGSTTFNLPNLTDRFIQGNATSGTVKSAGLPNITGGYTTNRDSVNLGNQSGAFINTNKLNATQPADAAGSTWGGVTVNFDASKSNSIYGNSTTVQPPALTMRYIIKY